MKPVAILTLFIFSFQLQAAEPSKAVNCILNLNPELKALVSSYLEDAYEMYLEERRSQPLRITSQIVHIGPTGHPEKISFRNQEYTVVNFLGEGADGIVYHVRDQRQNNSIIKVFKSKQKFKDNLAGHLWISLWWSQKVVGVDFSRNSIRMRFVRGIRWGYLMKYIDLLNAPPEVRSVIEELLDYTPDEGYQRVNLILNIDTLIVEPIDPI